MTVPSEVNRSGPYIGNGVTKIFDYKFKIVDQAHLRVIRTDAAGNETTLNLGSDYTVSGVGNAGGGAITISTAPASGYTVTILRNMPFTQNLDLENQGAYYAEDVERAFDEAAMRDQQLAEGLERAVKVPADVDDPDGTIADRLALGIIRLADSADHIDTVAGIAPEVVAVAGIAPEVVAVADVAEDIPAVASVADDIPTIASNIIDVAAFGKIYIGPKASDPTTRNDGSALNAGDLYFNTTSSMMRVFDGSAWQDASGQSLKMNSQSFTGNGSATSFTLALAPAIADNVIVWVGGVRQVPVFDYTVSGSTLTFVSAPGNGVDVDTLVIATVASLDAPDFTRSFATRAEFIAALPLVGFADVSAGGLRYAQYDTGFPQLHDAPGWYPLGVPEFEHYGGRNRSDKAPYAQIYHKHNFAANVQLDVVRVTDANLSTLRVISGKPDTASSAQGAVIRERLPKMAARHKAKAVLNFNAFRNSDGSSGWDNTSLVPNGFLIQDGKVITGWASGTNVARDQGFTFQCDGTMKRRTRGVGDAADYVADGAWFGSSWGAWIVQGGVNVSAAGASYFDTGRSARNLIGMNAAGDVVLLSFQGVTGASGPLYSELPALAAAEGLVDCYLLEGGGSTQIWWDNYYAMPSSDGDYLEERSMGSALGIFCDIQKYDTGWKQLPLAAGYTAQGAIGVRLRQVEGNVYIGLGVAGAFDATNMVNVLGSTETAGATNSSSWLFYRYRPDNGFVSMRGLLSGAGGQAGTWFAGSGISMRKLFTADTTGYLAGSQSWPSKHGPHIGPVD